MESSKHICEICQKICKTKASLVRHKTIHVLKPLYKCDICERVFINPEAYKAHLDMHISRKFTCHICGKVVTRNANLKKHITTHSPRIKTMGQCNICHKSLSKIYVKKHERNHARIRPFICSICGKSFLTRSNHRIHFESHNPGEKYKCSKCGICCSYKKSLKDHMKICKL